MVINQNKSKGLTLIELLFVVAIISILAMITISQYPGYIERAEAASSQYSNSKITEQRLKDAGVD